MRHTFTTCGEMGKAEEFVTKITKVLYLSHINAKCV